MKNKSPIIIGIQLDMKEFQMHLRMNATTTLDCKW